MQCHLWKTPTNRMAAVYCNLALILVCQSEPSLQERQKSQDSIMHGLSFHVRGADSCRQIVGTNIELETWFSKLCTLNQVYITP